MADSLIVCPKCKHPIPLTSAIEGPIAERLRLQFESESRTKDEALAQREQALASQEADLEAARRDQERIVAEKLKSERTALAAEKASLAEAQQTIDARIAEGVKGQREAITAQATQAARASQATELADLQAQLADKAQKLADAQQAELELRKHRRELEESKAAFELEVARKLDGERDQIRAAALQSADEAHRLREAEKDKQMSDMRQRIEELQRKAEQGSQQLQGEVLELELERMLRTTFPHDQITPVPKGVHGGDVVQRVMTPTGSVCGTILWESKRTKAWSDGWITKLKDDQRAAKADVAIIISTTMPKDCPTITNIDGVWVANRECVTGMAMALRSGLLQLTDAKRAAEGKHGKMEVLYRYLSGHEFKQRVEAIVESFTTMQHDLEQEKTVMNRVWAKRGKQIERVMLSTTGMHGDLAGIIGGELPMIETIDLPTLTSNNKETAPLLAAETSHH